ncbi:uncharacterized protein LOC124917363 [Impatiens glandulifera]|uniref:uncharacterized protein LOC124917363 n=1 Tax=Impatiens glandulifera TaxID=253017 RepID=UPI001FB128E4|nr:uncharacterized protein LOC124917363 [Impatiens glandulifera]XP_047313782.1 uncharacterized protein LOC124917363 [Impatiens glandulifera]XP_047313784.1 uncharacterized protein LOC124917363 [Impatiens glandulifera]
MGANQSAQLDEDEDENEEEEEEDDDDTRTPLLVTNNLVKKVLEQEPEMLPCHASASPLSPQLSNLGTPRLGPSIKVWDPCNVLAPPPLPPPPQFTRTTFSYDAIHDDRTITDLYLITHGDWHMNLRPDLIAGRCPEAALTPNGNRQARALAVFLKSQGIRFNAVYSSPLDRARATAVSVCQEMDLMEEQIQTSEALIEISQGDWEGCQRSEIHTPELSTLMERFQPDFSAPSGESLRQVQFRMIQFLNTTILSLPEKLSSKPQLDLLVHRQQHWHGHGGGPRKKSGKSRLQMIMTKTGGGGGGDNEADDEMSPRVATTITGKVNNNNNNIIRSSNVVGTNSSAIGIFSHGLPIKCVIMGLLGCSPVMSNMICVEDSSVTLLQHSWKMGWQIKRLNDTSHLRLL